MDPQQPYTQTPPPTGEHTKTPSEKVKFYHTLLIVLGSVTVILLILVLVFAGRAFINAGQLDEANQKGQAAGAEAQKIADEQAAAKLAGGDVRTYTSPDNAGNFKVDIPKSWSLAVTPDANGSTIEGFSMPDFVNTKLDQFALRFALKNQNLEAARKSLDALAKEPDPKKRKVNKEDVTVSGIKGVRYTGALSTKIPSGTAILIPIRDKTFVIQTDDNTKYLSVYNSIVENVRLNP